MAVGFLNGQNTPTLDQQFVWNTGGLEFKVTLDFGVGVMNPLTMFYSKGKA